MGAAGSMKSPCFRLLPFSMRIDKNKYEVVPIGITKAQELDAAIRLEEIGLEEERLRIERRDEAECTSPTAAS